MIRIIYTSEMSAVAFGSNDCSLRGGAFGLACRTLCAVTGPNSLDSARARAAQQTFNAEGTGGIVMAFVCGI